MKSKITHKVDGMEYEDMPMKMPRFHAITIRNVKVKGINDSPGIIRLYFNYLVEVILA